MQLGDAALGVDVPSPPRCGASPNRCVRLDRAVVGREQDAALDRVLQLADVAGPRMREHLAHRLVGQPAQLLAVQLAVLLDEALDQHRDVGGAFAQRRDRDRKGVEPIEEVGAELAGLHRLLQVDVGGGDDAHVDLRHLLGAEPLDLAGLQRAQQLDLHGQRQVAGFVEEQRAAVRALEAAGARQLRAGVGALLDAEELGLDQLVRDRRAVDGDERPLRARPVVVQPAREHLLADAGLAEQQHGDRRCRGALQQLECGAKTRRHADQLLVVFAARLHRAQIARGRCRSR